MGVIPKLYSKKEIERMLFDIEQQRNQELRDLAEEFKAGRDNIEQSYLKRRDQINALPLLPPIYEPH